MDLSFQQAQSFSRLLGSMVFGDDLRGRALTILTSLMTQMHYQVPVLVVTWTRNLDFLPTRLPGSGKAWPEPHFSLSLPI